MLISPRNACSSLSSDTAGSQVGVGAVSGGGGGGGPGRTLTVDVAVAEAPSLSVTVSVKMYVPAGKPPRLKAPVAGVGSVPSIGATPEIVVFSV